ncbi:MAG TPA: CPBP family intramembrane glutamic endopeptidase [Candidatus Limnocylindrales bacterium]|nr:CPBP family intramembrane glutamic endopeptidase [Candidatus Limnocylindrales bacterium]
MNEPLPLAAAEATCRLKGDDSGLVSFFVLTFLTSWAVWGLAFLPHFDLPFFRIPTPAGLAERFGKDAPVALLTLGAYAPTAWGIYFTRRRCGNAGLRELFARLGRVRVPVIWLVAVILLPALCNTLTAGLITWSTGRAPKFSAGYLTPQFILWVMAFGGPMNEELGWRGFALPRLLQVRSSLVASVGLGLIWALWHLPLFFVAGSAQRGGPLAAYIVIVICLSIFMTAAHLGTGGSLLVAVLFHTAGDAAAPLWRPSAPFNPLYGVLPWLFVAGTIVFCRRTVWLVRPSKYQYAQCHQIQPNA